MRNLFDRQKAPPGRTIEVKAWVKQKLKLGETDLISVAELACHEPDCPPVETVLTVHDADGERRTWKVHKPLLEIEEADVLLALTKA